MKHQGSQYTLCAAGVTTLDEARYFSAMGADWIGFDVRHVSAEQIRSMMSWVAGPRVFVEWDATWPGDLSAFLSTTEAHGVAVRESLSFPGTFDGVVMCIADHDDAHAAERPLQCDVLIVRVGETTDAIHLPEWMDDRVYWIETDWHMTQVQTVLDTLRPHGVVIRCIPAGEEDVFAYYDAIIETVRISE